VTTIAVDKHGVIAADRAVTDGSMRCNPVHKLTKLPDGRYMALAGELSIAERVTAWIVGGQNGDPPAGDYLVVVMDRKGAARELSVDENGVWGWLNARLPAAWGSGAKFATAALDLGLGAKEAVEAACKRDVFSGGGVDWVNVKEQK
jgi:20S proteasome alpha/beta subunit